MAILAFSFFCTSCAPCSLSPFCCFNLRWKHGHALHTSISSCCEISFPAVTHADQCPSIPTARADSTRTEWIAHASDDKSGTSSNHCFASVCGAFLNVTESMFDCMRVHVLQKERENETDKGLTITSSHRASLWAGKNACDWMRLLQWWSNTLLHTIMF